MAGVVDVIFLLGEGGGGYTVVQQYQVLRMCTATAYYLVFCGVKSWVVLFACAGFSRFTCFFFFFARVTVHVWIFFHRSRCRFSRPFSFFNSFCVGSCFSPFFFEVPVN